LLRPHFYYMLVPNFIVNVVSINVGWCRFIIVSTMYNILHSTLNKLFYNYILIHFTFMPHVFVLHSQSQRTNSIGFFGCKQRSKNFTLWTSSIWIANLCARTSIFKFGLGYYGTHVLASIFNRRWVQRFYICMINGFRLW